MNEFEISRKLGPSSYTVFNYIKANPTGKNIDIELDLGLSDKTVKTVLLNFKRLNMVKRERLRARVWKLTLLPETEWTL